jgi:hypothetical protein
MFNPFKKKPFGIDDFAKLVITEARKARIAESLEYDPKSFVLKRGDRDNSTWCLAVYLQTAPKDRERMR